MNFIKNISSSDLLKKTRSLVLEERRITLELIEHLREVDRRLLFAEMGYGSLFEFVTKYLGLSEGAAQRRIQAMRLVRDLPEALPALESGELSLSNAAKVQSFFQMEKKQGRVVEKELVLEQIQGLSQRECEQKLYEISPQSVPRERERVVSAHEREIKVIVSEDFYQKLQRLRGLLAHAMPEASYAELLEYMTDIALGEVQKKKFGNKAVAAGSCKTANAGDFNSDQRTVNHAAAVRTEKFQSENVDASNSLPVGVRVALPRQLQREVWLRAGGQCEYEAGARRCRSIFRLEIDHQTPLAQGGSNDAQNLRLLCRVHNTQQARQKLGFVYRKPA